jgi:hypothetical protein
MNKFEQLIEYVINDEEAKARELFHELVVEKSRAIYEEMMAEEEAELDEAEYEEIDEVAPAAAAAIGGAAGSMMSDDENVDEGLGGDAADDLIDDIEVEEEGISMEAEGDMESDEDQEDAEEELEDRVVDLEDKLDELMSEFESLMGDEAAVDSDEMDMDAGEEMDMDAGEEMDMDMGMGDEEMEVEGMKMPMEEAVSLKSAPAPVKSEEGNINKKSVVAANAGAKGAAAHPVKPTGTEAQGRPAPGTKELIGKVGNTPAQSTQKPTPAPKAHTAQATGVNTKSVIQ